MNKRMRKKLEKKNEELSKKIWELAEIDEERILRVDKNGVVQIDWDNPKHVEIYNRWIQD